MPLFVSVYIFRGLDPIVSTSRTRNPPAQTHFAGYTTFFVKGQLDQNLVSRCPESKNISYHDAHSCFREIQLVVEAYQ